MTWWLLYDSRDVERNKGYIELYFKACEKRGIHLDFMVEEDLEIQMANGKHRFWKNGEELDFPDAVINRTRSFRLAKRLELMGCRVFNNSKLTMLGNDKELALAHVEKLGGAIMPSFTGTGSGHIEYPCVMKTIDGHGGTEVFWISEREEYERRKKQLAGKTFFLQKAAADIGKDLRVYVIGNEIVAAMLRTSQSDFRSNFCLGGTTERYQLSDEEMERVQQIIESLEIDFCGIDFIFDHGELVFNEIEDVVGARMLYAYTDIDVVELYVKHILKKCRMKEKNDGVSGKGA